MNNSRSKRRRGEIAAAVLEPFVLKKCVASIMAVIHIWLGLVCVCNKAMAKLMTGGCKKKKKYHCFYYDYTTAAGSTSLENCSGVLKLLLLLVLLLRAASGFRVSGRACEHGRRMMMESESVIKMFVLNVGTMVEK